MIVNPEPPQPGEQLPEIENNPDIEKQWVVVAVKYAETYMKLVSSVKDHKALRLSK